MKLRLEWYPSNAIIWGWGQGEMGHHFSALYLLAKMDVKAPRPPPSPAQPQEHAIQENQMFKWGFFC